MARSQHRLKPNEPEFEARSARPYVTVVEQARTSSISQEGSRDVAPSVDPAATERTSSLPGVLAASAAALSVVGSIGALVYFGGIIATLAACVVIVAALVLWGFWVLDNTIEV